MRHENAQNSPVEDMNLRTYAAVHIMAGLDRHSFSSNETMADAAVKAAEALIDRLQNPFYES